MNDSILGKSLAVREEKIKDWRRGGLSKRKMPVYISKNKTILVDVYDVPLDFPIYRLDNIRTFSDQESHLAKHKDMPKDFFKDPECREALALQHRFLFNIANSGKEKNHYELFKTELFKEGEELILNSKGILLNGNTRVSAIRQLVFEDKTSYSHFHTIPMAILPSNLTPKQEKNIEILLQIQPDIKKAYKWTSEALSVRRRLEEDNTIHEISEDFNRSKLSIGHPKKLLNQLRMADKYLKTIDSPGDYELVLQGTTGGNQYVLDDIFNTWNDLKNKPKEAKWWLIFAFSKLSSIIAGKGKGNAHKNMVKDGKSFKENPLPYIELLKIDLEKKPGKDDNRPGTTAVDDDDLFGGLTKSGKDDKKPIPDPDKIDYNPDDLDGILTEGTAIIEEEKKRKQNRNQLFDDVNDALAKFKENMSKIKDDSNEFDKINETLEKLEELAETLKAFKTVLANKKT